MDSIINYFRPTRDLIRSEDAVDVALSRVCIRNDPNVIRVFDGGGDGWNASAARRLGCIVGKSTSLKELDIWGTVSNNPCMEGLCAGLQHNRSIERLSFSFTTLGPDKMRDLSTFLSSNPRLGDVTFFGCRLEPECLTILWKALASRDVYIERLCIGWDDLRGVGVLDELVEALRSRKSLKFLSLSGCGIGRSGCSSLAKLLESDESALDTLDLNGNAIDDDGAIILAESLAQNIKLRVLHLKPFRTRITKPGWSAMLALVCNGSSIEDVMKSNHVLVYLGIEVQKLDTPAFGADDVSLLSACLKLNRHCDEMNIARRKIIWSHVRGNLNVGTSSPLGTMPQIISWFGGDSRTHVHLVQYHDPPLPKAQVDTIRLNAIYRILRARPVLCEALAQPRLYKIGKADQHAPDQVGNQDGTEDLAHRADPSSGLENVQFALRAMHFTILAVAASNYWMSGH